MKEFSFEEIYRQVAWELCVEAASTATTDLSIFVYDDIENQKTSRRVKTIEAAADQLLLSRNGGVLIDGDWKAGGKRGKVSVVYVRQFAPTATQTYIVRFINELIRLQIAKELNRLGDHSVDESEPTR